MTNIASFIGYIGRDAETVNVGSATVTKFSVGNTEYWTKKDGTKGQRTTWMRMQWWNCNIANLLQKGRFVAVVGKLAADQFETKDGQKRTDVYIRVDELTLLDKAPSSEGSGGGGSTVPSAKSSWDTDPAYLDDDDVDTEAKPWD